MSEPRTLTTASYLNDWRYLFFSFDGRISRKPFWIGTAAIFAIGLLSLLIESRLEAPQLGTILGFALLYPDFAVMVKRARDRDMSLTLPVVALVVGALTYAVDFFGFTNMDDSSFGPWDLFAILYLIFSIYLLVILGFFKGTPGPNRYGPDPLANKTA